MNAKKLLKKFRKKVPVYIPVYKNELLKGRTALITGGTRGIGYAIAEAFSSSGCNVIITGRNQKTVDAACKKLNDSLGNNGQIFIKGCALDISDMKSISSTEEVFDSFNVDILVNNAGMADDGKFGEMSETEYDNVMNTNLKGTYFLSQTFANYLIGKKMSGNILNIASSSSLRPATLPYTLSKWGIRGFTEGLAKKLIPYGIIVNGIAPGQTATDMVNRDSTELNNDSSPIKRLVTPVEIGNMATVLVSDMGKSIVGDIIYMTGGSGIVTYDDINY